MIHVNPFYFVWLLLCYFSIEKAIDKLNVTNDKSDYRINFLFTNFYIIQTKKNAKTILGSKTQLPFLNKIFDASSGLKNSINAYDMDHPAWKAIHYSLKQSVLSLTDNELQLQKLVTNCIDEIKIDQEISINGFVDDFMMKIWPKIMFGDDTMKCKYFDIRKRLLKLLQFTFYKNRFNKVPLLGYALSKLYFFIKRNEFEELRNEINDIDIGNGFIKMFHDNLMKINELDKDLLDKIFIDNFILSILVYDFVHIYLLGLVLRYARSSRNDKNQLSNDLVSKNIMESTIIRDVIKNNFLFPMRARYAPNEMKLSDEDLVPGSYCFINLLEADLLFSHGPRKCVGYYLVKKLTNAFVNVLLDHSILRSDKNQITRVDNTDTPFIVSQHMMFMYRKNYIRKFIPSSGQMLDIGYIYSDQYLVNYITEFGKKIIEETNPDVIITPESRGFPIAGILGYVTKKPIYLVKKKGKSVGDKFVIDYTRGHSPDEICTMEISKYEELKGKKVICIDDGLSSGGTAIAMKDLINKTGCEVVSYFYMVRHHYCKTDEKYHKLEKLTEYAFDIY